MDSLTKLDVLDLHGNQISYIENLNHLSELRVLNLAGNKIEHVDNLMGMDALTELNLRRNHVRTVVSKSMTIIIEMWVQDFFSILYRVPNGLENLENEKSIF